MKSLSSQVVVSDADVIIKLFKAKHLDVLEKLDEAREKKI